MIDMDNTLYTYYIYCHMLSSRVCTNNMYVKYTQPIQVLTLSWISTLAPAASSIDAVESCPFLEANIRAVLPSYEIMIIG
jgi:hypothetical protein